MIQTDYEAECKRLGELGELGDHEGEALTFNSPPNYSTFRRVLRDPHFANLRFHRAVDIGRCPKCCFLRWKCMSLRSLVERQTWQQLAAAHQNLQLEQKKVCTFPVAQELVEVTGDPGDFDNIVLMKMAASVC